MSENPPSSCHPLVEDLLEFPGLDHDDEAAYYSWEQKQDKTWENVRIENGVLVASTQGDRAKSVKPSEGRAFLRGVIRNVVLVVDMSSSMAQTDYKPDRATVVFQLLEEYLRSFFVENPLSQLGVIFLRSGDAVIAAQLDVNADTILRSAAEVWESRCQGIPSVVNGLQRAIGFLKHVPPYATKEVIVIYGSLKTCDAKPIEDCIDELKAGNYRLSVVMLSPEMYILRRMAEESGGSFGVAMNREHLRQLVMDHVRAPIWTKEEMMPRLVLMGFPDYEEKSHETLCFCHNKWSTGGYKCPKCQAKACEVPCKCSVCGMHLASSIDICRTHRQIYSPKEFLQLSGGGYSCIMCWRSFSKGGQCPDCSQHFCKECNDFLHSGILYQCPTCITLQDNDGMKIAR
eukprot:GHVU01132037.1.p1 GENE.GHVU01132037.1~~GHVU01132037.1.p1  ORF type:complete len:401 (+),score=26.10 GHVU01132037.1:171-1373(+)